jgi:hypothetical protein
MPAKSEHMSVPPIQQRGVNRLLLFHDREVEKRECE